MDKKIIAVICASLIVISVVFASCGKKKPTINAKDATYEVVTDEEGNTVLNENGEIEIYVISSSPSSSKISVPLALLFPITL